MVHFPTLSGRAYVVVAPEHAADFVLSGTALLITLTQPDDEGKTEKVVRLPASAKWHLLGRFDTLSEEQASTLVFRSGKGHFPDYTQDLERSVGFATAIESLASAVKADASKHADLRAETSLLLFCCVE